MASNIVILTGAGVSAESGLGTFRDKDGLWTQYDLAEVATPEGYAANPELVLNFYNARRDNLLASSHNAAHEALARLQREWPLKTGGQVTLVTQNVDNLHEQGGSPEVIHMHGELLGGLCHTCGHRWRQTEAQSLQQSCGQCQQPTCRPDVVWFGEIPYHMELIETRLMAADVFVSIGTSGEVYPAAGFVQAARDLGAHTVELNLEPSAGSRLFAEHHHGPATEVVPAWVDKVLG